MSIEIKCPKFWTYNTIVPRNEINESERQLPLTYLNEKECTHIHGELQIIINNRTVPHLGYFSADDVCIGYWVKELSKLFFAFQSNKQSYTIYGDDQGKPDYQFAKENDMIYLTIVASVLGGGNDPDWQRIGFPYKNFKYAFHQFQEYLLLEIAKQAPDMLQEWNEMFLPQ